MAWIILISGILNLFLGLIVWLRDVRNKFNTIFWLFSLSTVILILLDFLFRFQSTLFVLRSSYAFASLVPLSAFFWVLEMCKIDFKKLPLTTRIIVPTTGIAFFILPYVDGLVVKSIESLTLLGYKGVLGPLFPVYCLYFLSYILGLVILLYRSQKHSLDKVYKLQIQFILLGIYLYGFSALLSSLVLPVFFNVFDYTMLDAPSLIFFVGFTAYAILKLHLFNIKVITTELLVFALSGFLLLRTITSDEINDQIINGAIFLGIVIVGAFLIKSVLKEVSLRESLEVANEQQTTLLHFISHEVKGFLAKSRGIFSLFLEEDYGPIPEYLKVPAQEGLDSGTKGVEMVQEILGAANFKNGKVVYKSEPFDLKQLLLSVLEDQTKNATKKGLTLQTNISEHDNFEIIGDSEQMKHVLKNLVDNSIKYTPEGGLQVGLSLSNQDILFSVKDTGVGINPLDRAQLFTEGVRGRDAMKVNVDSTGYGLFIVRKIVEAHKGKVWVESEGPGHGSTFYVQIPRHP